MELHGLVLAVLRWIHVLAGVIWIGHLYFLNFVNGPFEKGLDASMKKPVIPALRPRALYWFRWGAMVTFLSGWFYLAYQEHVADHTNWQYFFKTAAGDPATKNWWISLGALFGTIMWYNVWFVIWPNQKQILAGIATGNKPTNFDALVNQALFRSRMNTFLSVPLLFAMGARQHFASGSAEATIAAMVVVVGLGFATAWFLIFKVAGTVGKEFLPPAAPAAPAVAAAPAAVAVPAATAAASAPKS